MNGSTYANVGIKNGSADYIPNNGNRATAVIEVEYVPAKRKQNENLADLSGPATGPKRAKPSDHHRASSSSKMDSMADIGASVIHSSNEVMEDPSNKTSAVKQESDSETAVSGPVVSQLVDMPSLPRKVEPLRPLTNAERKELESYLEFNKEENWREDWMGNLCFVDKEINNPDVKTRERGRKALFYWAAKGKTSLKLLNNLVRYVYNLSDAPLQAKKILANADASSAKSVQEAVRRVSYDPVVLQHDGWTTIKSEEPIGASGGPFRLGDRVIWQGSEGVVIAYVHDPDIGDLWKAIMIEELDTFDLEAEELEDGRKRFQRRMQSSKKANPSEPGPNGKQESNLEKRIGRSAVSEFSVQGIEHGIVLAVSYGKGARPGVLWPARVQHFSELPQNGSQKRLTGKQKVEVVFLAPYWNAQANDGRARSESYADSLQRHGSSIFSSGPLFEIESIEASPDSIIEYPYEPQRGLDIEELSTSFRFNGLPKAAFSRFVQSHRLALALKTYSQDVMKSTAASEIDRTTANLFEAHALAGQTANFPPEVLHLPFSYILSQLPVIDYDVIDTSSEEPILQIGVILESMKPPSSWGQGHSVPSNVQKATLESGILMKPFGSPSSLALKMASSSSVNSVSFDQFLSGLSSLSNVLSNESEPMSALLIQNLRMLLSKIPQGSDESAIFSVEQRHERLEALVKLWIVVKVRPIQEEQSTRCQRFSSFVRRTGTSLLHRMAQLQHRHVCPTGARLANVFTSL